MFEILTPADMRRVEDAAPCTDIALMTAAGNAVAARIRQDYVPAPVLVLCGKGNNGGDGFMIAGLLEKAGWPVRVACSVKVADLKGVVAQAAKTFSGKVEALNSNLGIKDARIVVDAVFGTGFSGALEPELVTLFDKVRAKSPVIVAVDIPSGIDADSGDIAEGALKADTTVAFCRKKPAHMVYPARAWCGRIFRADIGIDDAVVGAHATQLFENDPALWLASLPIPSYDSHKYTRGHVSVYGGDHRTGAAALAARAAQRAGAGAVSIATTPDSALYYRLSGASLMVDLRPDAQSYAALLEDPRRNTVVIGPGALPAHGGEDELRATVASIIATPKIAVLDGDVFRAFEHHPHHLLGKLDPARHVLTPHAGEFQRLFGALEGSKIAQARTAAHKANAVIVFKGADTVIAAPEGLAVVDTSAPPTLATAGAGDVLAGLIAGFAAQGMPPFFAACAAVYFHSQSARHHGLGLTAEDIISHIPQTLNDLFRQAEKDT